MARKVEDNALTDDERRQSERALIERARRALAAAEPANTPAPDILHNQHARKFHDRLVNR